MTLSDIPTPALVVDVRALERNIRRMADFFASRPCALRPHFKAHKTPEIARRQLDFPVFARSVTGRTARGRIVEVSTGEPILVGDVTVNPGDYAIADASSVVFIPQADIARVIEAAALIVQRESLMAQALRDGKRASEVMGANYEHMLKK